MNEMNKSGCKGFSVKKPSANTSFLIIFMLGNLMSLLEIPWAGSHTNLFLSEGFLFIYLKMLTLFLKKTLFIRESEVEVKNN